MRGARLRALIAAASAASLVLLLLLPAGALGGRAEKGSDHFVEIFCDFLTGDDGTLFFGASISETGAAGAGLEAYGPGVEPFTEPPTFIGDFDALPTGSFAGGVFTMDIPVLDGTTGEPAGSATIEATIQPTGAQEAINERLRDGNRWLRSSGWFQPYEILEGTATLPDGSEFDLVSDVCFSNEVQVTFFGTNPSSFVSSFRASNMSCPLSDDSGVVGNVFVDIDLAFGTAFVHVFFNDPFIEAVVEMPVSGTSLTTPLEYFAPETGDPAGTGELTMAIVATGERFSYTLRGGTGSTRVHAEIYDVEGSLSAPGFGTFDLGECVFADQNGKDILSPVRAPKPTGAPPANDVPSGARIVAPGRNLTQNTKNAALDMEEPFSCLISFDDEGNEVPLPVIKTVWYQVTGADAPVTFDTKGSGFDTVIGVYTKAEDGSYVPVDGACIDDVPLSPFGRTLQASVTFDAAAGTTYYVQIGGFPFDLNWGSLHLRVR